MYFFSFSHQLCFDLESDYLTNIIYIILQLKDLQVFTVIRVIFQLAEEIPCISAVVVALLAEVPL